MQYIHTRQAPIGGAAHYYRTIFTSWGPREEGGEFWSDFISIPDPSSGDPTRDWELTTADKGRLPPFLSFSTLWLKKGKGGYMYMYM